MRREVLVLFLSLGLAAPAFAQPIVESPAEAIAEDSARYAVQFGVTPEEALRRLKAEQASVAATDSIRAEFADRLAGISIDNGPEFRIVVLLTGDDPVAPRTADGVPIIFQTGAKVTREQAIAAMRRHLIDLRRELPGERGAGYDQRTGDVVLLVPPELIESYGADAIRQRAEAISGVPVRIAVNDLVETNMAQDTDSAALPPIYGGERVTGIDTVTGHGSACTTGFVVSDGARTAIATAAHCADQLTYTAPDGTAVPLPYVDQWGLAYRDVQINLSPTSTEPLFYADAEAGSLRRLVSWRNRDSTRAGDFVCHDGIGSGYSCATIELTDYAPPGELCGGPCEPTWVTVKGPDCAGGDSGGPVFLGGIAFGLAKGMNHSDSGRCNFYYYMSTDYLPPPWKLMVGRSTAASSLVRGRKPGA